MNDRPLNLTIKVQHFNVIAKPRETIETRTEKRVVPW